ncbi:MAG: tyrosine-type recombinase/integrase [Planctomycetia bacterium]|nr:tyrosine-type recombinase/integrase [Planctomycetia bacterium]
MPSFSQSPVSVSIPKLSFFQSAFYVYIPTGNGKYQRQYIAAGNSEQRAAYKAGSKPEPNATQIKEYAAFCEAWEAKHAGETMEQDGGKTLVKTLVSAYLSDRNAKSFSESWLSGVAYHLNLFCETFGEKPLAEIKAKHVATWVADQKSWVEANTKNSAIKAIKALFSWAETQEILIRSPVKGKALPLESAIAKRDYLVSAADEETISRNTNSAFNQFFRFCLLTGCRPSEAASIEAADIQEHDGVMSVRLLEHKTARKTGKARIIPVMFPEAILILRNAAARNPSGKVFRNKWGKPIQRNAWVATFCRLAGKGIVSQRFTLYTTRHTFITRALLAGIPIAHVATFVGNTVAVLERHYGHLSGELKSLATNFKRLMAG